MKGHNQFLINQATMMEIVEDYLRKNGGDIFSNARVVKVVLQTGPDHQAFGANHFKCDLECSSEPTKV